MRCVLFRVSQKRYALPLSEVREVLAPEGEWAAVPMAPSFVRGVFQSRGRVVLAVDLGVLLHEAVSCPSAARVVLLARGRQDVGLAVTEVEGLVEWNTPAVSPADCSNSTVWEELSVRGESVSLLHAEGLESRIYSGFSKEA